jgi:hypothetical protein
MYKTLYSLLAIAVLTHCGPSKTSTTMGNTNTAQNAGGTLSREEQDAGWVALFDGRTLTGWHSYGKAAPGQAWRVDDGAIHLDATNKNNYQTAGGGDLLTDAEYENYHLKLDWKIAPNGNSGIIFNIKEDTTQFKESWHTGLEMQVLDNDGHSDGKIPKHRAGNLYDLIAVSKETVKPVGEWNTAEIVSNRGKLDLYLNGEHVVDTRTDDAAWRTLIAGSKFKDMPGFATYSRGRIGLQDHGDNVWFRNIRLKQL